MQRLIIAEKPSMARSIADALGSGHSGNGFITCGATTVTWCAGHLLEPLKPEDYSNGAFIRREDLPVIPATWKYQPRDKRAKDQLKVIQSLLKDADEVVNAGDADREGQLLVDEVLIDLGWRGKTLRLWTGSLDEQTVKRALAGLKSNESMRSLYDSALARQRADWLLGYNASIALSRNLKAQGLDGGWSVGRVQTPTLALIVDRAAQIKGHTKQDHYKVHIALNDGVTAQWQIPEDLLSDKLLLDKAQAETTAKAVEDQTGVVREFTRRKVQRAAPLPFSLAELQMRANDKLGLSAKQTLEAAQALYDAKATTYPRSDCRFLPEEMHRDAGRILQVLGVAGDVDASRKHAAWNDREISAHHAIIPTGQAIPAGLDSRAVKVFELIRESYVRLFMPDEEAQQQQAIFAFKDGSADLIFKATARKVLAPGWTALGKADSDGDQEDASNPTLPEYAEGQTVECVNATIDTLQTKPPKPYTDKTLIAAMIGIHKLVADPKLKARLKETSGLGTEATRAVMIETLIDRGYTERKGKEILPTERGIRLIGILRETYPAVADPGETALQEDALADIAAAKLGFDALMESAVQKTRQATVALSGRLPLNLPTAACPACDKDHCIQLKSKAGHPYWKCRDCQAAFGDNEGQPGKPFENKAESENKPKPEPGPPCPKCKQKTSQYLTLKNAKPYYRCAKCSQNFWPDFNDPQKIGKAWELKK
jgi:DNA topoisomerase-3